MTLPARAKRTARQISSQTWGDLEALFGPYGGVQNGCWCMYYHREGPVRGLPDAVRIERNRTDHRALVAQGKARGVLVYEQGRPIGWCQFGLREELPRIEHGRTYAGLALAPPKGHLWRITCFFVDRAYRRSRVAEFALRAALEAIRDEGGGTVEAFPATHPRAVSIWFGTVGMFERQGFRTVRPFGPSHVLMRRTVRRARS